MNPIVGTMLRVVFISCLFVASEILLGITAAGETSPIIAKPASSLTPGLPIIPGASSTRAAFGISGLPVFQQPWISVGPSPIQSCRNIDAPPLCSGRVTAIALDPTDKTGNTVYIGGAQGGVWKSGDGGSSWTPLTDNQPSLAVGSIAVDSNGNIYVGTGEGNGPTGILLGPASILLGSCCRYGAGILKSTDKGSTWTQLGASTFGRSVISKIVVNGSIVIASTRIGLTSTSTGTSGVVSPGVPLGIYASTDGGATWCSPAPCSSVPTLNSTTTIGATDLVMDPANPAIVYAAIDGQVYVSTNSGTSWTRIGIPSGVTGAGRINFGISAASPDTVFVVMNVTNGSVQLWKDAVSFITTASSACPTPPCYSSSSWTQVVTPIFKVIPAGFPGGFGNPCLTSATPCPIPVDSSFCETQCFYDLFVAVDPASVNILYLGGLDLYRTTNGNNLCSTGGGLCPSWTDLGGGGGSGLHIHTDQHAFLFDYLQSSPTACSPSGISCTQNIYAGNDGGVWSTDRGETIVPAGNAGSATCGPGTTTVVCWTNRNAGLSITQFQSLAAHPTDPNTYFGGTQDNDHPGFTGSPGVGAPFVSSTWASLERFCNFVNYPNPPGTGCGGDGGWTAFDPNNPAVIYDTWYGLYPRRWDATTSTWIFMKGGLFDDSSLFYPPMAVDPKASPTTLYLGTYRLYKTTIASTCNSTSCWSPVTLNGPCQPECGLISAISAITVSGTQYVYIGTSAGKFFASNDGGTNFSEIDSGLPTTGRFITGIAVNETNPSRVFITFSGFVGFHVFLASVNFGTCPFCLPPIPTATASWSDISSNLPDVPADSIILDAAGNVYVGTDAGVYLSIDAGVNWLILGTGLPRVTVVDLVFAANGTLLAATHGRGIWALRPDFTIASTSPVAVIADSPARSTISVTSLSGFAGTVALTDTVPLGLTCGAITPNSVTLPPSPGTVTLSCTSTASGSFTVTITGTSGSLVHTVTATFTFTDFTISASSPTGTVGTLASTITVTGLNGFTGTVALSYALPPSPFLTGFTCGVITPTSVMLSSSPATATLSCTFTPSPPNLFYTFSVTITGASGALVHTATATFTFMDFTLSASSPTGTVGTLASTITVTGLNGFTGTVALSYALPPSPFLTGFTCGVITPTSVMLSSSPARTTLSCNFTPAPNALFYPYTFTVSITGTSGSLVHTAAATFTFTDFTVAFTGPCPVPSLFTTPCPPAVSAGSKVVSNITVTPINGFTGTVALTDNVPQGLNCVAITPSSVMIAPSLQKATLSCSSTIAGTFTVTVTGTSGSLSHSTTTTFTFTDFSLAATSPGVTVGSTANSTITVTAENGFAGKVTLTDTIPTGLTCGAITPANLTFTPLPFPSSPPTATLSCTSRASGTFTVTITATSGTVVHSTTATIQVTPPQPTPPQPFPPALFYIILALASVGVIVLVIGMAVAVLKRKKAFDPKGARERKSLDSEIRFHGTANHQRRQP